MMQAVNATYDGKNFVPDENINLSVGQKAVVTILNRNFNYDGVEEMDKYLATLRKEKNLNLKNYKGVGKKMFATTEDIDNYVKELRNDD